MLAASTSPVAYIHEPFSPTRRPGICRVTFPFWFYYVCEENEVEFREPIRAMLGFEYQLRAGLSSRARVTDVGKDLVRWAQFLGYRRRSVRPLVKDPLAVFSADWLSEAFHMDVVMLTRHPAAFVSSLMKAGWTHPFDDFMRQPLLMRDRLHPFSEEIASFAREERTILEQGILLWRLIHHDIAARRDQHPEWHLLRHEDISRDPERQFESLFAALGLEFGPRTRRAVREHSSRANPADPADLASLKRDSRASVMTWKERLSSAEIATIREGVEDVSGAFYGPEDW
jgi:hypothetical protein